MVKFFYEIQTFFEKSEMSIISKVSYRVLLYLIRIFAPLYYLFLPTKKIGVIEKNSIVKKQQVIVSLTTFPPRMKKIWMVLESLLRQTEKPDKIILWLSSSQFPSMEDIDIRVRKMQKRGLEIRFCNDYKSHKKYFFTMKEYSNDIVITVDDDIYYPENMIETLLNKHNEYPDCIVCYRAHKITLADRKIKKYSEWDILSKNIMGPDHLLISTNGGGALYPPGVLHEEVFNINAIQELCPNADDIWLKCMSAMKGTRTVKVRPLYSEIFTTFGSADTGLAKKNVVEGQNDIQLQKVIDRYKIQL